MSKSTPAVVTLTSYIVLGVSRPVHTSYQVSECWITTFLSPDLTILRASSFKGAFAESSVRWSLSYQKYSRLNPSHDALVIKYARENNLPLAIKGGGSQLLVRAWVVIDRSRYFNTVEVDAKKISEALATASWSCEVTCQCHENMNHFTQLSANCRAWGRRVTHTLHQR